jgi:phytoene synthase
MTRTHLEAAYDTCEALVRESDPDRWLAALFVPEDRRRHVLALAAFSYEIGRIRDVVREPPLGEIRLQWWADTLSQTQNRDASGHPVADALLDTLKRFSLPLQGFLNLIEARRFDLYDDPMPTLLDLEGYAGETASILIQAAAIILCDGEDPKSADAAGHAGVAYAMTGLMRALPFHARRNQVFIPNDVLSRHGVRPEDVRDLSDTPALRSALAELREHARHHLDRALAAIPEMDARAKPAFIGLAFVEPYLKRLEPANPFGAPVEIVRWRKPLIAWRLSRNLARL